MRGDMRASSDEPPLRAHKHRHMRRYRFPQLPMAHSPSRASDPRRPVGAQLDHCAPQPSSRYNRHVPQPRTGPVASWRGRRGRFDRSPHQV